MTQNEMEKEVAAALELLKDKGIIGTVQMTDKESGAVVMLGTVPFMAAFGLVHAAIEMQKDLLMNQMKAK